MIDRPVALRPMKFDRLRLAVGGQAEFVETILQREQDQLYAELESAPTREVSEIKRDLIAVIDALKDVKTGLLEGWPEFITARIARGGQADVINDVFLDEQQRQLDHLADLRAGGATEDDEEVVGTRQRLIYVVNALRDMGVVLMNVAGPDADPR